MKAYNDETSGYVKEDARNISGDVKEYHLSVDHNVALKEFIASLISILSPQDRSSMLRFITQRKYYPGGALAIPKINPLIGVGKLTPEQMANLHTALLAVLRLAVERPSEIIKYLPPVKATLDTDPSLAGDTSNDPFNKKPFIELYFHPADLQSALQYINHVLDSVKNKNTKSNVIPILRRLKYDLEIRVDKYQRIARLLANNPRLLFSVVDAIINFATPNDNAADDQATIKVIENFLKSEFSKSRKSPNFITNDERIHLIDINKKKPVRVKIMARRGTSSEPISYDALQGGGPSVLATQAATMAIQAGLDLVKQFMTFLTTKEQNKSVSLLTEIFERIGISETPAERQADEEMITAIHKRALAFYDGFKGAEMTKIRDRYYQSALEKIVAEQGRAYLKKFLQILRSSNRIIRRFEKHPEKHMNTVKWITFLESVANESTTIQGLLKRIAELAKSGNQAQLQQIMKELDEFKKSNEAIKESSKLPDLRIFSILFEKPKIFKDENRFVSSFLELVDAYQPNAPTFDSSIRDTIKSDLVDDVKNKFIQERRPLAKKFALEIKNLMEKAIVFATALSKYPDISVEKILSVMGGVWNPTNDAWTVELYEKLSKEYKPQPDVKPDGNNDQDDNSPTPQPSPNPSPEPSPSPGPSPSPTPTPDVLPPSGQGTAYYFVTPNATYYKSSIPLHSLDDLINYGAAFKQAREQAYAKYPYFLGDVTNDPQPLTGFIGTALALAKPLGKLALPLLQKIGNKVAPKLTNAITSVFNKTKEAVSEQADKVIAPHRAELSPSDAATAFASSLSEYAKVIPVALKKIDNAVDLLEQLNLQIQKQGRPQWSILLTDKSEEILNMLKVISPVITRIDSNLNLLVQRMLMSVYIPSSRVGGDIDYTRPGILMTGDLYQDASFLIRS